MNNPIVTVCYKWPTGLIQSNTPIVGMRKNNPTTNYSIIQ